MPQTVQLVGAVLALTVGAGCAGNPRPGRVEEASAYRVARLRGPMVIDARWDKAAWRDVPAVELRHFMGERPSHFPRTQARLAYDADALYVIFRVEDRYVRAVAPHHQGAVCKDSCVEFFFTPGSDVAVGYFNLEMNCGGTMLFNYQVIPWKNPVEVRPADLERIEVAHTLPRTVEPEITAPTAWTVEYRLPTDLLAAYCPTARKPAPGVRWRANLYKCGDDTSHPHWLTWAPVANPTPNFHMPQSFATIVFE